jgi:quercetin dioxygenase-like cupin family protein
MEVHSITKIKDELPKLVISEAVTEEQAMESMRILGNFNRCMIGITHFSGTTPWERHEDDEFLQVLEGNVELLAVENGKRMSKRLRAGECFVVPKNLWHRQSSDGGGKVMFITSREGNQTSHEESPRDI